MNLRTILVFSVLTLIFCSSCSQNRDESSSKAMQRLESQIKSESFEQIYNESSEIVRNHVSKEEFIEKMNTVVKRMKSFDDTLNFQKDESYNLQNGDVYGDLHFVYRNIGKIGKGLNVFVTFAYSTSTPIFFDLCVDNSIPTEEEDTLCVTNAIKER